jgi:predicted enzyme related to lactoylglutathione lyase
MANPVVYFGIIGKDAPRLRTYYKSIFEWEIDTNSQVASEVSAAGNYCFVDKIPTSDGGGIGGGANYTSHGLFMLA